MAIALSGGPGRPSAGDTPNLVLGGYTALAESAWMGAAQASDVLESVRAAPAGQVFGVGALGVQRIRG